MTVLQQTLYAYDIEMIVPSSAKQPLHSPQTPQALSGSKPVEFFTVGTLNGRTLVVYMKKKCVGVW